MTATRIYRPSEFVVWTERTTSIPGTKYDLRKLGTATTFVDNAPARYGSTPVENPRFVAVIEFCGDANEFGHFDEFSDEWTLTTQGDAGSGGRRYRHRLAFDEAQRAALAWLDRRFSVAGVEG